MMSVDPSTWPIRLLRLSAIVADDPPNSSADRAGWADGMKVVCVWYAAAPKVR
jgi:hypothetical protein